MGPLNNNNDINFRSLTVAHFAFSTINPQISTGRPIVASTAAFCLSYVRRYLQLSWGIFCH